MTGLWMRLKQRKMVQWALAYLAGAWALLQVLDLAADSYHWPDVVMHLAFGLMALGFLVTLVLAWYHGERGVQRVSGTELLIVALLLGIGGALLWRFTSTNVAPAPARTVAASPSISAAHASMAPLAAPSTAAIPAKSIAVLPFKNLSDDKKNAYFVAGIQDLILTKLADIGDLKVIARTSTAKYASNPDDLKTIGRELGVATILEGSVQKAGDQVLINVQLIHAADRSHVWAQSYTRTLEDVFGVEGEVAGKIADALKAKLSHTETARLASNLSHDSAANDLYFKAEYQVRQAHVNDNTAGLKAAIPLYKKVLQQDPTFALAHARLSLAESGLVWVGGSGIDVKALAADARRHAEQALKLAPKLPAAHIALGDSDYVGRSDYAAAEKALDAALALRPNDTEALRIRGYVLRFQGHFKAAIESLQQAFTLDPRSARLATDLAATWMLVSDYPQAESWARRALAINPRTRRARRLLSRSILYASGDIPRALAEAHGDSPQLMLQRVSLLTLQRKYRQALALLDRVPDTPDNFPVGNPKILMQAEGYQALGDTARARSLYAQAARQLRAQLAGQRSFVRAQVFGSLAEAELGLGHTTQGLKYVAQMTGINPHDAGAARAEIMRQAAARYAQAKRADLAVPQLSEAMAAPGIGWFYSPVMLWIDPAWDPIRKDPKFQALLRKYARDKPAVIPAATAPTEDAQ